MAGPEDDDREPPPAEPSAAGRVDALDRLRTTRKREAEEWLLVLASEGFDARLDRAPGSFGVVVPDADRVRAASILEAWRIERAERARRRPPPPPDETTRVQLAAAYLVALAPIAFHVGLVRAGRHDLFVAAGECQAALVMEGELWRTVTALTLHADAGHVAGNALFGGFFLAALAGRVGLGCALLAFFVSGALGNVANAVYYGAAHSSIGASTGVFGLVGVLAGLAGWRRQRLHGPRRGAWVAFAAGLAVVAMIGGPGPQVDFSGHLFGLAAGGLTGLAISWPLAAGPRPGRTAQALASAASGALVFGAWRLATHA